MNKRILIVEDEALVAEVTAIILEDAGYDVVDLCATAAGAIARVDRLVPDLVLLDINLEAGGDGIEVGRVIAERYGVPFVFVTAQTDRRTKDEAMATGPAGYLTKPYDPELLLRTVAAALERGATGGEGERRSHSGRSHAGLRRT